MESAAELKSVAAMPPPFESNENESNGNSSSYSINQHEQRSRDVDDDNINDGKDVIDNNSIKSSQSGVGDECTARDEDKDTTHQIVLESDDPDVCGENADNEDDTGMDDEIVVPPPRSHSTAFVTTQAFLDDNETATGPDGSGKSIVGGTLEVTIEVLLFLMLGASGWWSANAITAEFPVFKDVSPEQDRFPALANVAYQAGNVFPIAYKFIAGYCVGDKTRARWVTTTVYGCLLAGIAILMVCAFFWKTTLSIGGVPYSGILLLMSMFAGGVGSMSNVTYWAFASRYPVHCTKSLSTGMTFGALIASGIILGQDAGEDPKFSTKNYFFATAAIQLLMLVSTLPIMTMKKEKSDHVAQKHKKAKKKRAKSKKRRSPSHKYTGGDKSKYRPRLNRVDEAEEPLLRSENIQHDSSSSPEEEVEAHCGKINSVESGHESHEPPRKGKIPFWIDANGFVCCVLCFLVYGMTYALPAMIPYVVQGYKCQNHTAKSTGGDNNSNVSILHDIAEHQHYVHMQLPDGHGTIMHGSAYYNSRHGGWDSDVLNSTLAATAVVVRDQIDNCAYSVSLNDDIYKWSQVLQNVGDITGRMSTAFYTPKHMHSLVALAASAVLLFASMSIATGLNAHIPVWFPGNWGYIVPVACLMYYFLRGYVVTSMYVWVKQNMVQADVERLSSNMGMLGQLGALLGNLVMLLVTYKVLHTD